MRRRNNRRNIYKEDSDANKIIIISATVLLISILAFFITFFVYRNYLNKQTEIAKTKTLDISSTEKTEEEQSYEASSSIGKKVNEIAENETSNNEVEDRDNEQKIAINTSNMEKENVDSENEQSKEKDTNQANTSKVNAPTQPNEIKKEKKIADPVFVKPTEGEIVVNFAKDSLIYSNTLQEWVTHNGIDIKAEKTAIVKASEEGVVKSIKNDPRYGISVVIEHAKGFSTVYSNLLTAEFIKEGENVNKGQTIGTVGNTATFEIADEPHLHFEIIKDGEYVDPEIYLK